MHGYKKVFATAAMTTLAAMAVPAIASPATDIPEPDLYPISVECLAPAGADHAVMPDEMPRGTFNDVTRALNLPTKSNARQLVELSTKWDGAFTFLRVSDKASASKIDRVVPSVAYMFDNKAGIYCQLQPADEKRGTPGGYAHLAL